LKTPSTLLEDKSGRKIARISALPGPEVSKKAKRKRFISARTKAPLHSSCEIPILTVLAKSPTLGLRTKIVLNNVESKWFKELSTIDLGAVYPHSRRKVVDTIIKYSRKTLVEKGQILPADGENHGIWKATTIGIDRTMKAEIKWIPKYVRVFSMIEAEEEKSLNEIL